MNESKCIFPLSSSSAVENSTLHGQKLVILAGPHKTASTSIQHFFTRWFSSSLESREDRFDRHGWVWPAAGEKDFASLVLRGRQPHWQHVLRDIKSEWTAGHSLIIGSEEFSRSRAGATGIPAERSDSISPGVSGMMSIVDDLEGATPSAIKIIINYRAPRSAQWLSAWKEATAQSKIPYEEYICEDSPLDFMFPMNSLDLAYRMRRMDFPVVLVDMDGVAAAGLDISHTIACSILCISCSGGWVSGIPNDHVVANRRVGNHSLSDEQHEDIDWLFLQRDCYYQDLLSNDPQFKVLFRRSFWRLQDCSFYFASKDATWKKQIHDDHFVLAMLRSQVPGCHQAQNATQPSLMTLRQFRRHVESSTGSLLGQTNDDARDSHSGQQKLVLFAGPHKTGSTAVEQFFDTWFSPQGGRRNVEVGFNPQNWVWPAVGHKAFANILLQQGSRPRQAVLDHIYNSWYSSNSSLIVGAEDFSKALPPKSFEIDCRRTAKVSMGYQAMNDVLEALGNQVSPHAVVLTYRTPRSAQWISVWKQDFPLKKESYSQWICSRGPNNILLSAMNALGLANQIRQCDDWPVVLVDYAGVAAAGTDTGNAIACKVLNISCSDDGWVHGIPKDPIVANARKGVPGLTAEQVDNVNWLFLQRDCYYESMLSQDSKVQFLYNTSFWRWEDCSLYRSSPDDSPWKKQIQDDWFVLDLLKSQVNCANLEVDLALFRKHAEESSGWKIPADEQQEYSDEALQVLPNGPFESFGEHSTHSWQLMVGQLVWSVLGLLFVLLASFWRRRSRPYCQ